MYLARAVDPTIVTALSVIASQQASPTERRLKHTKQLLDYLASQEEAIITYRASPMILAAHSDAGYLNEPQARSRAGGGYSISPCMKHSPPQWIDIKYCTNYQKCNGIGGRGGARGVVHQCEGSGIHPTNFGADGTSTNGNSDPD
jgi:hypothetical protein